MFKEHGHGGMGVVFIELCSYSTSFVFRNILSKVDNLEMFKLFEADFTLFG